MNANKILLAAALVVFVLATASIGLFDLPLIPLGLALFVAAELV